MGDFAVAKTSKKKFHQSCAPAQTLLDFIQETYSISQDRKPKRCDENETKSLFAVIVSGKVGNWQSVTQNLVLCNAKRAASVVTSRL